MLLGWRKPQTDHYLYLGVEQPLCSIEFGDLLKIQKRQGHEGNCLQKGSLNLNRHLCFHPVCVCQYNNSQPMIYLPTHVCKN